MAYAAALLCYLSGNRNIPMGVGLIMMHSCCTCGQVQIKRRRYRCWHEFCSLVLIFRWRHRILRQHQCLRCMFRCSGVVHNWVPCQWEVLTSPFGRLRHILSGLAFMMATNRWRMRARKSGKHWDCDCEVIHDNLVSFTSEMRLVYGWFGQHKHTHYLSKGPWWWWFILICKQYNLFLDNELNIATIQQKSNYCCYPIGPSLYYPNRELGPAYLIIQWLKSFI